MMNNNKTYTNAYGAKFLLRGTPSISPLNEEAEQYLSAYALSKKTKYSGRIYSTFEFSGKHIRFLEQEGFTEVFFNSRRMAKKTLYNVFGATIVGR